MSGQNQVPFFEMFSCCRDTELHNILEKSFVVSATVDKSKTAMQVSLLLPGPVAPVDIALIEEGIRAELELASVAVSPLYTRSAHSKKPAEKENPVIYGKEPSGA